MSQVLGPVYLTWVQKASKAIIAKGSILGPVYLTWVQKFVRNTSKISSFGTSLFDMGPKVDITRVQKEDRSIINNHKN